MTTIHGYETWWSAVRQLWWRDFDSYGHLTASCYATIFHDVMADFVVAAWEPDAGDYVAAQLNIRYIAEIRPHDGPVRVHIAVSRIGRAGFDALMVLRSADSRVCSTAEASYVAWDRDQRRSRVLTQDERHALVGRGL